MFQDLLENVCVSLREMMFCGSSLRRFCESANIASFAGVEKGFCEGRTTRKSLAMVNDLANKGISGF